MIGAPGDAIDPWLLEHLVCPRDRQRLTPAASGLVCGSGHRYPVVDGVPVMLLDDVTHTISIAGGSMREAARPEPRTGEAGLYLDSIGISDEEKRGVMALAAQGSGIDPVVAYLVAATNGLMYKHLIGHLDRYPIPDLPLPAGRGRRLVDIGCSWGRWSLAAQRLGYETVGVDPSLGAVMAARRVARQLGADSRYVVADARYLPFADQTFDVAFSYSVVQHFSHVDAELAVSEMGRLLRNGGIAKVQLPTRFGVRCLYHQARRGFRSPREFEVRYRTLGQMARMFESRVGPPQFEVDGYFGIGLQRADEPLMTPALKAVLRASEGLKQISRVFALLVWLADSVWVQATRHRS